MLDYLAEELSDTTGWRRVLEAYATLSSAAAAVPTSAAIEPGAESQSAGWVTRLSRLDGVEPDRLSALHGKLIALGLLSFEVTGKSGVQYQLSPLGRRALGRGIGMDDPNLESQVDETTAED
jgi:hypothetical protein